MNSNEVKDILLLELVKLNNEAIKAIKEKGVEPEMLNAIRENIRLILTCLGEL